jgi:hypothetical protein
LEAVLAEAVSVKYRSLAAAHTADATSCIARRAAALDRAADAWLFLGREHLAELLAQRAAELREGSR